MSGPQDNWQAANDFANDKLTRFAHVQKMLRSHISGGFWLGGVSPLCPHLLQGKNQVAFEYQGQHWPVVFMQEKSGFSGGWRQCAMDNELVEGDVVVYEVVSPDRLKLYFFRSMDWNGSRAQRPSLESMQYPDAPAINWNGRKPVSTVEGRRERGATAHATPGGGRGTAATAASPRIRIKLPSSLRPAPSTAPSSPLPTKNQKRGSAVAMQQSEDPGPQDAAGPSSPPAAKRQKRGSAVAPQPDEGSGSVKKKEQAAKQQQGQGTKATRGGGARAAEADREGAGSGRPSKSKSLMDLVHSSPTVQLECEDDSWGSSSGGGSEGGDDGGVMDQDAGMLQKGSKEKGQKGSKEGEPSGPPTKDIQGGPTTALGTITHHHHATQGARGGASGTAPQSRGQRKRSREGGDDKDVEGLQERGSRDVGTGVLSESSKRREEAGERRVLREGQRKQQYKGGGVGDEEQVALAQAANGDGSSQKAAKRQVQSSERAGSAAGKAGKGACPQLPEQGGGVSRAGAQKRSAQPEPKEQGGGVSGAGVHRKSAAGKGSRVLDMQAVGGTGTEVGLQKKKSVTTRGPGLQQGQGGQSPKSVASKGVQPHQGLPKAKESVGSRAAAGVTSPAGRKAQATKPRKTAGEKGPESGAGVKCKGGSAEVGGGQKEKEKGGKSGVGGPSKKRQAPQSRANQSRETGPDVARFPERRRTNAQPIEGRQMGLVGEEALQGFWNIAEPEYDCEALLHEIGAVAKAEVRPVVVDEASGNCINAPPTLTISGSLGTGWTYDPQSGYFPVRFVNREGYYMRLEDGA
ncbi:hypothetical protein DUNSADRAFT_4197 [Dunaliella salina]|uniref:TF-B3 domain-containing protein n=1 Tax=Dunaliella salina TaxID=3046 RepID=A0ABQ7GSG7_DUNSA|nr:hypothetical protein DUNSADRAFT_4197 [Dunaliella salina]|eukprot:KAF5837561.1 hypothetical protein DUNSADRAFT_4197 [Dunaliella salina]